MKVNLFEKKVGCSEKSQNETYIVIQTQLLKAYIFLLKPHEAERKKAITKRNFQSQTSVMIFMDAVFYNLRYSNQIPQITRCNANVFEIVLK